MKKITLAHSPDADDAFMFYALAKDLIDTGDIKFEHKLEDIQSLNQKAKSAIYDVTAVSVFGYAFVRHLYTILPHGASVGTQYGPLLISKEPIQLSDLHHKKIAIPGEQTTAFLALKIFLKDFDFIVTSFDQVYNEIEKGNADVGLIIHEGQLTFRENGFHAILDLGKWWYQETGLPLPLGLNVIKSELGDELMDRVSGYLKASICYSLEHREEALTYALSFGRGLNRKDADQFVGMYVNEETVEMSKDTRKGIQLLYDKAYELGLIKEKFLPQFAENPIVSL